MDRDERPFQGGAQPVRELPPEVATRGRVWVSAGVVIVAVAVMAAAVVWLFVLLPS
jgi:hypothetical protein